MFDSRRSKEVLGIDFGDKYMKMSVIKRKEDKHSVYGYSKVDIEPYINSGRIVDNTVIRVCIKDFIRKHKLKQPYIILTLPNKMQDCSLTRFFEISKLKSKEMEQAMEIEIEDKIPLKEGIEFIPKWTEVEGSKNINKQKIFLVVANKETLNSYFEVFSIDYFKKCKLSVQSKTSALTNNIKNNEEINLIIDAGHTSTDFIVSKGQTPLMVRSINVGGKMFTEMIARFKNINIDEAEELKKEFGCIIKGNEDLSTNITQVELSNILTSQIDLILAEIKKTIFITSTDLKIEIDNVYITGGSSKLNYLPEYISRNIEKDVSLLVPHYLSDNLDEKLNYNYPYFNTSFSCAVQSSLKPRVMLAFSKPKENTKINPLVFAVSGLVFIIGITFFHLYIDKSLKDGYFLLQDNQKLSDELTIEVDSQRIEHQSLLDQNNSFQGRINEKIEFINFTERLLKEKKDPVDYLELIRDVTPTNIQLDDILLDDNYMELNGVAGTYSDVGYFVKELDYLDAFTNIDFSYTTNDENIGEYIIRNLSFNIKAEIISK